MQFLPLGEDFKGGSENSSSEDPTGNIVYDPFYSKFNPSMGQEQHWLSWLITSTRTWMERVHT